MIYSAGKKCFIWSKINDEALSDRRTFGSGNFSKCIWVRFARVQMLQMQKRWWHCVSVITSLELLLTHFGVVVLV